MRHHAEFCADRSNRCGDTAVYNFSTRRPSAFLNFKKFKILIAHALRRAEMHHHAKVCANRSRRCGDMAVFDFSRWRSSVILDFQKLEILTAHTLRRSKMRHLAEFCADRSNRCRDMAVYNCSRWRRPPSWILKSYVLPVLWMTSCFHSAHLHHATMKSAQCRYRRAAGAYA